MLQLQTDKILQQEMDRKMFLKTTAIAVVGLIGVTAAVKRLNVFGNALTATPAAKPASPHVARSYGNSAYGV